MPDLTLKQQLDGLFGLFGVSDYPAAEAALTKFKSDAVASAAVLADRSALWQAMGVTDQAGAMKAWADAQATITQLRADATGHESALETLRKGNETLTADLTAARGQITTLEASQKDFDGRLEAEVIKRAAAAGLPAPVPKGETARPGATTTPKSHLGRAIALAQQQQQGSK